MKEKTAAAKVALSIKCKSVKEIYPARRRRQPQAPTQAHTQPGTHTHNQANTHTRDSRCHVSTAADRKFFL